MSSIVVFRSLFSITAVPLRGIRSQPEHCYITDSITDLKKRASALAFDDWLQLPGLHCKSSCQSRGRQITEKSEIVQYEI